jgi:hypothetical protein
MPLGSLRTRCFCVVNDCDESVAVLPNVGSPTPCDTIRFAARQYVCDDGFYPLG